MPGKMAHIRLVTQIPLFISAPYPGLRHAWKVQTLAIAISRHAIDILTDEALGDIQEESPRTDVDWRSDVNNLLCHNGKAHLCILLQFRPLIDIIPAVSLIIACPIMVI